MQTTNPNHLAKKPPAAVTHARREEVYKLRLRGLSIEAVATTTGVNRNTIIRDLQWIRSHLGVIMQKVNKFEEVGDAVKFYAEMEQEALFQYHECEGPAAKNHYLMTAIGARRDRMKLLMDAGIIPKAADKIDIGFDPTKMTREELLQKREELIKKLRDAGVDAKTN